MTVAINDIVRVNCNFQFDGVDLFTNVFHFKITKQDAVDDDAFMDAVALEMDDLYTIINPIITNDIAYIDVDAQNITQNELLPAKAWPALTVGGDAISNALPTQVAACVFFRTLRPKTRASKFIAGLTETNNVDGGVIQPAALAVLQTWGNSYVAGIVSTLVDADYGAYNKALDRFTQVIQARVPTRFRTQRRRRVGVGS